MDLSAGRVSVETCKLGSMTCPRDGRCAALCAWQKSSRMSLDIVQTEIVQALTVRPGGFDVEDQSTPIMTLDALITA